MQSSRPSISSLMTLLLLHSSMCSDTGTEYGMGGRPWLLGLSDRSAHGVSSGVAGSSLTGMGVASGAGMHCALDRSSEMGRGRQGRERDREAGEGERGRGVREKERQRGREGERERGREGEIGEGARERQGRERDRDRAERHR